jgi:hypothetical protein
MSQRDFDAGPSPRRQHERAQEVVLLYADGTSMNRISEMLHICKESIHNILVRRGIPIRNASPEQGHKCTLPPDDELLAMYEAGTSATAIATRFHASKNTVLRHLYKLGVQKRTRTRQGNMPCCPRCEILTPGGELCQECKEELAGIHVYGPLGMTVYEHTSWDVRLAKEAP